MSIFGGPFKGTGTWLHIEFIERLNQESTKSYACLQQGVEAISSLRQSAMDSTSSFGKLRSCFFIQVTCSKPEPEPELDAMLGGGADRLKNPGTGRVDRAWCTCKQRLTLHEPQGTLFEPELFTLMSGKESYSHLIHRAEGENACLGVENGPYRPGHHSVSTCF